MRNAPSQASDAWQKNSSFTCTRKSPSKAGVSWDRTAESRLQSASTGQGWPPVSLGRKSLRGIQKAGCRFPPHWAFILSPGPGLRHASPARMLSRLSWSVWGLDVIIITVIIIISSRSSVVIFCLFLAAAVVVFYCYHLEGPLYISIRGSCAGHHARCLELRWKCGFDSFMEDCITSLMSLVQFPHWLITTLKMFISFNKQTKRSDHLCFVDPVSLGLSIREHSFSPPILLKFGPGQWAPEGLGAADNKLHQPPDGWKCSQSRSTGIFGIFLFQMCLDNICDQMQLRGLKCPEAYSFFF